MAITFERNQLYEEVWATPLTTLGKKYGLSDNGLRKICKALNVPLPVAGHWARVAAGRKVPKTPLPTKAKQTSFVSNPPPKVEPTDAKAEDLAWCAERESFEKQPENLIVVPMPPERWHKAILKIRHSHHAAIKEFEALRKSAAARANKPASRIREPNFDNFKLSFFRRAGEILVKSHKSLPMKVSVLSCERALAIANALLFEAERRGFEVSLNEREQRFQLTFEGTNIYVWLAERVVEKLVPDELAGKDAKGNVPHEKRKVPTGILRLLVGSYRFDAREIADEDGNPVEAQLNQVFTRIYRLVVRMREEARLWEEERRKREIERLREEEVRRCKAEQERLIEEERRRRKALLEEANAWADAERIRQYVAHIVASRHGEELPESLAAWAKWALNSADELDPSGKRVPGST